MAHVVTSSFIVGLLYFGREILIPLAQEITDALRLKEFARITRLYKIVLSTTNDFAYIFDPQGRFLYANARLLKVYARTLDQVVRKIFYELGYPHMACGNAPARNSGHREKQAALSWRNTVHWGEWYLRRLRLHLSPFLNSSG